MKVEATEGQSANVEIITPEESADLLRTAHHNRNTKETNLRKISRDMAADNFLLNGETLKLDDQGRLIDGHHRCLASVKSGKPFKTWVIRGIKLERRPTVDTGSTKTPADLHEMSRRAHAAVLASAEGWYFRILNLREGMIPRTVDSPTQAEAEKIRRETTLEESVERVTQWVVKSGLRVGRSGLFAALHCLWSGEFDRHTVDIFVERALLGVDLDDASPIYKLRSILGNPRRATNAAEAAALTIKAFTFYKAGRSGVLLKWSRKGHNKQPFPSWRA